MCLGRSVLAWVFEDICHFFSIVNDPFTWTPHSLRVELWCWLVHLRYACIPKQNPFCNLFLTVFEHFILTKHFQNFEQDCNKLFNMDMGKFVGSWSNLESLLCFVSKGWHPKFWVHWRQQKTSKFIGSPSVNGSSFDFHAWWENASIFEKESNSFPILTLVCTQPSQFRTSFFFFFFDISVSINLPSTWCPCD